MSIRRSTAAAEAGGTTDPTAPALTASDDRVKLSQLTATGPALTGPGTPLAAADAAAVVPGAGTPVATRHRTHRS
ncbi:hypothetical protein ACFVT9_05265 [Kitasatospora cineracea]|uniref:hypothetical protein n=1 Tax=Kitasatospora cineracea TaxID=88074 RepID=UPI0036D8A1FC